MRTSPRCAQHRQIPSAKGGATVGAISIRMEKMLIRVLAQGHDVCIESGRLVIRSVNGLPVPQCFLDNHGEEMFKDILAGIRPKVYVYYEYSTGAYDARFPGITLQFRPVFEGDHAYAIFNVDLTRERDTKTGRRGEGLPPGHFRIKGERCAFYKFWKKSGAEFPRRTSAFHDYMGRLKGILFMAELSSSKSNRLDAKTLRPLSISAEVIRAAFLPDKVQTTSGQMTDKSRTNSPDSISAQTSVNRDLQPKFTTGALKHGKAVYKEAGLGFQSKPSIKRIEDQSNEEWTARLCSPG